MEQAKTQLEPWLRETLAEYDPLRRAVLHALELTTEDAERWAAPLSAAELFARAAGLPSVAFQLRHIVRSLDRLLSYAEGAQLDEAQLAALKTEMEPDSLDAVWSEFHAGMQRAMERVQRFSPEHYELSRGVGRRQIPTTVGGLLIHCAEHTQRHTGQLVTTAKLVLAMRPQAV